MKRPKAKVEDDLPDDPFAEDAVSQVDAADVPGVVARSGDVPTAGVATVAETLAGKRKERRAAEMRELHEQLLDGYMARYGCVGPGSVDLANAIVESRRMAERDQWLVRDRLIGRAEMMYMISDLVSEGGSLKGICSIHGMPNLKTVMRWRETYGDFDAQMNFAERVRALLLWEERLEIVDGATAKDSFVAKLQADVRQDFAGLLDRKYHPKTINEVHVTNDANPDELKERLKMALLNQKERMFREMNIAIVDMRKIAAFVLEQKDLLEELGLTVVKNANFKETVIDMGEIMKMGLEDA